MTTILAALQQEFMSVLHNDAPPADARMAIYHRTSRANWRGALVAAYPVVRRLVGDSFFAAGADAYARAFPSTSGDLGMYGAQLAGFLGEYEPARSLEYLPDVARLEWAVHQSYGAADARAFDFAALREVPEDRYGAIRLRLDPATRLMESAHPVVAIWEANQPERDGTPQRSSGEDRVLVLRSGYEPRPRSIALPDWKFLRSLAAGAALAHACDALGEDAAQLQVLVERYTRCGAICGFDLAG